MTLTTYQDARRFATRIRERTAIRDRIGAMPPFFVEPGIEIQRFKNGNALSDEELAKIQAWVDNGVPEGDPADMPPPLDFPADQGWVLEEPDRRQLWNSCTGPSAVRPCKVHPACGCPGWSTEVPHVTSPSLPPR